MIPASRSHYATYKTSEGGPGQTRPVIAWDDDGHPMVVGNRGLVRAEECGNFVRVREDVTPVVGAIPGGGWLIHCTDDDGVSWTDPILAWTIHADGTATPLSTDRDGVTDDATSGLSTFRIHHPDAVQPTSSTEPKLNRTPDPDCSDCSGDGWIDVPEQAREGRVPPVRRCRCWETLRPATAQA